jgi:hypothetical protein
VCGSASSLSSFFESVCDEESEAERISSVSEFEDPYEDWSIDPDEFVDDDGRTRASRAGGSRASAFTSLVLSIVLLRGVQLITRHYQVSAMPICMMFTSAVVAACEAPVGQEARPCDAEHYRLGPLHATRECNRVVRASSMLGYPLHRETHRRSSDVR